MNTSQQTIRVGFFFLLGVALIWVTFATLSGGKFFEDRGYKLTADFDDLKELKLGDEIRMAGVKIGSVESTREADAGHMAPEAGLQRINSKRQDRAATPTPRFCPVRAARRLLTSPSRSGRRAARP